MKNHARRCENDESHGAHLSPRPNLGAHSYRRAYRRAHHRANRVLAALAFACAAFGVARADAEGLRLRVRGSGRVSSHASRSEGELVFSGTLTDDASQPLAKERVTVRIEEEEPGVADLAERLRAAHTCDGERGAATDVSVDASSGVPVVVTVTDEGGRYCFRAPLPIHRYRAVVAWKGSALVDGATSESTFDLGRRALVLDFDPAPHVVWLDAATSSFEVVALSDEEQTRRVAPNLTLRLTNEGDAPLATAVTDAFGRARFSVTNAALGKAGPGELRVSYPGDGDLAAATQTALVERRANVTLDVVDGAREPANPEDGIPLVVRARANGSTVDDGAVEASLGDTVVGTADVREGLAKLVVTFSADGPSVPVRLRYVPTSSWFDAASDVVVHVPLRGPNPLRRIAALGACVLVLAFFLAGRIAAGRAKRKPLSPKIDAAPAEPTAAVEIVATLEGPDAGFRGRVVDAHERTPVANARVWIERGSFEGVDVLASTTADADGRFSLPDVPRASSERLVAEGRIHQRLTRPLPASGEIVIALVARKRALLARLVGWAKWAGAPFDARPEPTPGHVRNAAIDRPDTARWAGAVERAVFGPDDVDAEREAEIAKLSPRPDGAPSFEPGAPDGPPRTDGSTDR